MYARRVHVRSQSRASLEDGRHQAAVDQVSADAVSAHVVSCPSQTVRNGNHGETVQEAWSGSTGNE